METDIVVAPRQTQDELLSVQNQILILKRQMVAGVHYGPPYPGSKKSTLLKPGAEMLKQFFGLGVRYEQLDARVDLNHDDLSRSFVYFRYRAICYDLATGAVLGEAIGSSNSLEDKYFRTVKPVCPLCGSEALTRSKEKPEYFCWKKLGGCGAVFPQDDPRIVNQPFGKVRHPNPMDLVNTIDKKAQKRAFVSSVILCVGAGSCFTPDDDSTVDLYPIENEGVVEGEYTVVAERNEQAESAVKPNWRTPENIKFLIDKLVKDGVSLSWLEDHVSGSVYDANAWAAFESGKAAYQALMDAYARAQAPAQPKSAGKPDWDGIVESGKAASERANALESALARFDLRTWIMERFDVPFETFIGMLPEDSMTALKIDAATSVESMQDQLVELWMNRVGKPIAPMTVSYRGSGKNARVFFSSERDPIICYSRTQADAMLESIGLKPFLKTLEEGDTIADFEEKAGWRFVVHYKRTESKTGSRFDLVSITPAELSREDIIAETDF